MYTRYFRKKNPTSGTADVEWVEMSGKEYYSFVTAPENRNRYFVDMGDVVLECSKAEHKNFKAEDDHSSYILEQSMDWITLSLSELGDGTKCSGEELLPDEAVDVCDRAIQNIRKQALRRALQQLSEDEYRMIILRYHPRYAISEQKIGDLFALSQSGVSRRLKAIKNSLKKFVIESEKSSQ